MKKIWAAILVFIILPLALYGCQGNKRDIPGEHSPSNTNATGGRDKPHPTVNKSIDAKDEDIAKKYKDMAIILDTVVDVFREPDIASERVTQAIYNQPVVLLEKKEPWVRVRVVDGYTGWIREKYIDTECTSIMEENFRSRIVITGKTKKVSTGIGGGITLKDVVMGTELYVVEKKDRYYNVALPGGISGWIESLDTIEVPVGGNIPKTSAEDFLDTLNKFTGTPYLWGGVSSWQGLDCSGLVYICARINGVELPRDADQQYESIEEERSPNNLKPGDLLFFSSGEDLADVSHVGVFVGEDSFIHAGKSKGAVAMDSINSGSYRKKLKGVKRIFE
ncbi:MAG: C40 family peptidase [Clostridium sp.]|nr:C40 family peptidase [Clostridium sp.]